MEDWLENSEGSLSIPQIFSQSHSWGRFEPLHYWNGRCWFARAESWLELKRDQHHWCEIFWAYFLRVSTWRQWSSGVWGWIATWQQNLVIHKGLPHGTGFEGMNGSWGVVEVWHQVTGVIVPEERPRKAIGRDESSVAAVTPAYLRYHQTTGMTNKDTLAFPNDQQVACVELSQPNLQGRLFRVAS